MSRDKNNNQIYFQARLHISKSNENMISGNLPEAEHLVSIATNHIGCEKRVNRIVKSTDGQILRYVSNVVIDFEKINIHHSFEEDFLDFFKLINENNNLLKSSISFGWTRELYIKYYFKNIQGSTITFDTSTLKNLVDYQIRLTIDIEKFSKINRNL